MKLTMMMQKKNGGMQMEENKNVEKEGCKTC